MHDSVNESFLDSFCKVESHFIYFISSIIPCQIEIATTIMKLSTAIFLATISASSAFCSKHENIKVSTALSASRRDIIQSAAVAVGVTLLPQVAFAEPRPMYLTEPTDEFKANEARAMEFKRQQLLVKKEFNTVLDRLIVESNDADALVKDLTDLKMLVARTGGLPLGIKKDEVFKVIRSKKAKGFWPTPVEIAYQSLISEISFQQSPNLDKDMGSPYQ